MNTVRISRWINVHFGSGRFDEMYSSYAYREKRSKTVCFIDFVAYIVFNVEGHCRECYVWEKEEDMDYPERAEADFGETVECTGCPTHIRVSKASFASGLPFCEKCWMKLPECHTCETLIGTEPFTVFNYADNVALHFCTDAERTAYFGGTVQ